MASLPQIPQGEPNPKQEHEQDQASTSHSTTQTQARLHAAKTTIRSALRQYPNWPIAGVDFVDIMPLFGNAEAHGALLEALELQMGISWGFDVPNLPANHNTNTDTDTNTNNSKSISGSETVSGSGKESQSKPDVIIGLDARGFLFAPTLAHRLSTSFAPVRKRGKLPGPCISAEYVKEYGSDWFQMQRDAVREGERVLIVDDIIATGGSAKAAADLVTQLGGQVIGFLFILEVPGLNGREKLGNVPVTVLLDEL